MPINKDLIGHYIASFAQMFGFLDERKYRNFCIKEEYEKMRTAGMKVEEIYIELSQRYSTEKYPLQPESIRTIMFRK